MKRILAFLLFLMSAAANAQFVTGQILTAAQLNNQFALYLPLSGGSLSGPLSMPSATISGTATVGTLIATTAKHTQQEIDGSYVYSAPTTGSTVTIASGTETEVIDPAGTLATLTVTLPACSSGYDGSVARFSSSQTITALTVNAASGTVSNAPTTIAAGGGFKFICRGSNTKWYVIP